jgi:hypothetical protein
MKIIVIRFQFFKVSLLLSMVWDDARSLEVLKDRVGALPIGEKSNTYMFSTIKLCSGRPLIQNIP